MYSGLVLDSILCALICNFYAKSAVDIANRAQWRVLETASCLEKIKNEANADCICLVVGSFLVRACPEGYNRNP